MVGCTMSSSTSWRMQLHKHGRLVRLYTKSGYDCTKRFGRLAEALTKAPARLCIIDSEVVACNTRGLPDFLRVAGS